MSRDMDLRGLFGTVYTSKYFEHVASVVGVPPPSAGDVCEFLDEAATALNGRHVSIKTLAHEVEVRAMAWLEGRRHDCGTVLVPIPDHMADLREYHAEDADRPVAAGFGYVQSPEFARDAEGRVCFVIDGCIAPALRAVWAAGFRTLGCCCGHGQEAGGIITLDTGTFSAKPRTGTQERYAETHKRETLRDRLRSDTCA